MSESAKPERAPHPEPRTKKNPRPSPARPPNSEESEALKNPKAYARSPKTTVALVELDFTQCLLALPPHPSQEHAALVSSKHPLCGCHAPSADQRQRRCCVETSAIVSVACRHPDCGRKQEARNSTRTGVGAPATTCSSN